MGILFSCCTKYRNRFSEERVPLRNNNAFRYINGKSVKGKSTLNDSMFSEHNGDEFIIDPEIQQFLDNLSSDNDAGDQDDDFEKVLLGNDD